MRTRSTAEYARSEARDARWRIAVLVSAAIAISYLDRQTLPWAIKAIQRDIPITNQVKAFLDSAFLVTYGLMYLGGGRLVDVLGTRRGFLSIMVFWSLACASHGSRRLRIANARTAVQRADARGEPVAARRRAKAAAFPRRRAPWRSGSRCNERSTAMGIINAGTAVGAVVAPPLIALVLTHAQLVRRRTWRWVFFLTGALGLLWTLWWWLLLSRRRKSDTPARVRASR